MKLGEKDTAGAAMRGTEENHNRPPSIGFEAVNDSVLVAQGEIRGGMPFFYPVPGHTFGGAEIHYAKLPVEE